MPITPFLNGLKFDPETTRIMGVALEMVCIAIRAAPSTAKHATVVQCRIALVASPSVMADRLH